MEETPVKITLEYTIEIQAPRSVVWEAMLGPETYTKWTAPFCEGSSFEGTWEEGSKILFLAPSGDGMVSEIAENRLHELVSIRHVGQVSGGEEDTTSEAVRAWAPSYESYEFVETEGGTKLTIRVETTPGSESCLNELFPKSLEILRGLCEQGEPATGG